MHFPVVVAALLLSCGLLLKLLNERKTSEHRNAEDATTEHRNAEDAGVGASGSCTAPTKTNSDASSSSATTIETNNSASTSSTGDCYQVFLSFAGEDVRKSFVSHLHIGLTKIGVRTFKDDEELRQGRKFGTDIFAAIKNSKIMIPVISENYGSSRWCLDELVQMMECSKNNSREHIVLPIFFKVEPAAVRHQTGSFKAAFQKHATRFDHTILEKWRHALTEVSDLSGWEHSEAKGFIADIGATKGRHDIEHLQKQLIRDIGGKVPKESIGTGYLSSMCKYKKVLILLDDVHNGEQLEALAGNREWFYRGSIILITTKNNHVLDTAKVDYYYKHKELNRDQSLLLFSRHAFQTDSPPSEFKKLANEVASTAGGLPLSLKVLGSSLSGKEDPVIWTTTLEKLKTSPPGEVLAKLKVSYEVALDRVQKQIFLDIACFFNGADVRAASYTWEDRKFHPVLELDMLKSLSLITIGDNHELRMHDQLRDLGREIVRETGKWNPWDYSNLWDYKDVLEVFKGNKGTDKIEAIYLSKGSLEVSGETANQDGDIYTDNHFRNLKSLKFLYVTGAHFVGDFQNAFGGLKWLTWQNCPSTFEANNFNVEELVVLDLSRSQISDEWKGWHFIKMAKKLKFLDLTNCECLTTVSLSAFKNLENLILRDCRKLEDIDSSSQDMKLKFIDLTRCESLRNTDFLSTCKDLKHLILRGCEEVDQIDPSIEDMKSLVLLDLEGCKSLTELPAGVGKLEKLEQLLLKDCRRISVMPDIEHLQNLKILNICRTGIRELPNGIGRLTKLQELDASQCKRLREETPKSFRNLSCLQRLDFHGCEELQLLPDLPSSLKSLSVTCRSRKLPSFSHLNDLKELRLHDCKFLECLPPIDGEASGLAKSPTTPFKLEILEIYGCESMRTVDVSQFNHLRKLSVQRCGIEVQGLDKLKHVKVTFQNTRV